MDGCEHEHTTEILFDAKVNQHTRNERKYEVAFCKDCNQLVNYYTGENMTADQIEKMFKDIKAGIEAIDGAATDLQNAIDETMSAFRNL